MKLIDVVFIRTKLNYYQFIPNNEFIVEEAL